MNADSPPGLAIGYFRVNSAKKGICSVGLKMPEVLIFSVIAIGVALSGCTKCGPIWDDWLHSPQSCKSDGL
jgi:hypothetical protein